MSKEQLGRAIEALIQWGLDSYGIAARAQVKVDRIDVRWPQSSVRPRDAVSVPDRCNLGPDRKQSE